MVYGDSVNGRYKNRSSGMNKDPNPSDPGEYYYVQKSGGERPGYTEYQQSPYTNQFKSGAYSTAQERIKNAERNRTASTATGSTLMGVGAAVAIGTSYTGVGLVVGGAIMAAGYLVQANQAKQERQEKENAINEARAQEFMANTLGKYVPVEDVEEE